ncbi:2-C-methyl-D-erythritol 4-phosphate cytidylyltransferase [Neptunicella marina]|uniref:2-C-methyl-D-erythritol 4-phosphate cytidylyltransferase n=1 Tax=Neptunicella marina TaxID=2125989 RepID=A0A8J6M519_9ALTE|nr:2-C-methyl-D-erythritol 4-phosphate cytidylyltransferase [Neptunicella marina]MBC3766311.1 2-C-methyl-D-erythritol 4-phosphate cytidylyltransferase [Neptunicella marina]
MSSIAVVVPAAGIGKRMQSEIPKQYLKLHGQTVLEHTLNQLISHSNIAHIYVVLHPDDMLFSTLDIADADWITTVPGGDERSDSVMAGILATNHADWILVHDAARPCVKLDDITNLLKLSKDNTGGILAAPVRDTMKRGDSQHVIKQTVCRENLWHAQTPQFFPKQQLLTALHSCQQAGIAVTDEASAIEQMGGTVKLVEGCYSNIKITHPEDLALAEFYINQQNRTYL